jgi:hypothetical protein
MYRPPAPSLRSPKVMSPKPVGWARTQPADFPGCSGGSSSRMAGRRWSAPFARPRSRWTRSFGPQWVWQKYTKAPPAPALRSWLIRVVWLGARIHPVAVRRRHLDRSDRVLLVVGVLAAQVDVLPTGSLVQVLGNLGVATRARLGGVARDDLDPHQPLGGLCRCRGDSDLQGEPERKDPATTMATIRRRTAPSLRRSPPRADVGLTVVPVHRPRSR